MTLAWYDPTNKHVSTDKNDPLFTPLGQLWPLDVKIKRLNPVEFEAMVLKHEQQIKDIAAHLLELRKWGSPMMEFKQEKNT